jgi:hypothetical protein
MSGDVSRGNAIAGPGRGSSYRKQTQVKIVRLVFFIIACVLVATAFVRLGLQLYSWILHQRIGGKDDLDLMFFSLLGVVPSAY